MLIIYRAEPGLVGAVRAELVASGWAVPGMSRARSYSEFGSGCGPDSGHFVALEVERGSIIVWCQDKGELKILPKGSCCVWFSGDSFQYAGVGFTVTYFRFETDDITSSAGRSMVSLKRAFGDTWGSIECGGDE